MMFISFLSMVPFLGTWRAVEGDYGWKAISSGDAETKKRNLGD